jgi:hypothetical protein
MKYLSLLLFFVAATAAQAQIAMSLSIKDRFYMLHEPIVATVNVTNLTGREITLSDTPEFKWFGFRILGDADRPVPARDLNYHLEPLTVAPGATAKRSVNLCQLYEIDEVGKYRIQATIYYDGLDKFFGSKQAFVDVADGHVIWHQTAGVPVGLPGAGQMRDFTLLSHQRGDTNTLYVRIMGTEDGIVYCTYPIGRLLDNAVPQAEFDSSNSLYILQLAGMRTYLLSKVSCNGEFAGQSSYSAPKIKPFLRRSADGALQLVGAKRDAAPIDPTNLPVPKLSDRPPGFPRN